MKRILEFLVPIVQLCAIPAVWAIAIGLNIAFIYVVVLVIKFAWTGHW